MLKARASYSHV